ncbi:hypothetical protein BCR35DRAFT_326278 [Leucosporidium creatinivorum]|uniref:FAD-binding domain-containing protein n=1 Tax=Leucosporidium creatinivorum TaxID=106004 RepID=A0A1Y2ELJ8_9BASI|nr:hypothetical protein BCR35DRAFT_326278 [Leucosporidium creatinivorum]
MPSYGPYKNFKTGREAVDAAPKTGISVIIVGAGIGGLTCAVECALAGHGPITVYESVKKFARLGDTIGIMPNAGSIKIWRYDGVHIVDQIMVPLKAHDGETAEEIQQREEQEKQLRENPAFDAHRGDLHQVLLDYAVSVGVEVKQGINVSAYEETATGASVIINGERHTADLVIGADGVKSKAREIVLGYVDAPKSSGYAIYRAFFDGDLIRKDPLIAHLVEDHVDQRNVFLFPDCHFICAGVKDTKEFSWVMTHKDEADVTESWTAPGKIEDALKVASGFCDIVKHVIAATPPDGLLDWKLVYRDPLPTWVSPQGRIALLGDAAHPFLPTSIQGASQSMEDGATISQVLRLAGKEDVPLALRSYQDIRYDRVRNTQLLGEQVRNTWHKPRDWDNIDPESVKLPHSPALFGHDATAHAIAEFPAAAERVRDRFSMKDVKEVEPAKDAPMDVGGATAAVAIAA